jgi:hypothetical protein
MTGCRRARLTWQTRQQLSLCSNEEYSKMIRKVSRRVWTRQKKAIQYRRESMQDTTCKSLTSRKVNPSLESNKLTFNNHCSTSLLMIKISISNQCKIQIKIMLSNLLTSTNFLKLLLIDYFQSKRTKLKWDLKISLTWLMLKMIWPSRNTLILSNLQTTYTSKKTGSRRAISRYKKWVYRASILWMARSERNGSP